MTVEGTEFCSYPDCSLYNSFKLSPCLNIFPNKVGAGGVLRQERKNEWLTKSCWNPQLFCGIGIIIDLKVQIKAVKVL